MVDIKLSVSGNGFYPSGIDNVSYKTDDYGLSGEFKKVSYDIKYESKFPLISWATPFYIKIIDIDGKTTYTYYTYYEYHIVNKVEVYYLKNKETPLVIGFKRDDPEKFQYYTYLFLRRKIKSTGFLDSEVFEKDKLDQKLDEETHVVKKNIIFRIGSGLNNHIYDINERLGPERNFIKYTYMVQSDKGGPYYFYSNNLFSKSHNKIDDALFNDVKDMGFEGIVVYYTSDNIPLAVVFSKGLNTVNYIRKDNEGIYWSKGTGSISENRLGGIKEEFESTVVFKLDKNSSAYSKDRIKVTSTQSSFRYTTYTHKPNNLGSIKKTLVFYNEKEIEFVVKDKVDGSDKLELNSIQTSKFTEIKTYVFTTNPNHHLLIKLIKDGKNVYFLHTFDNKGSKWRQVGSDLLKEASIDVGGSRTVDKVLNETGNSENVKKLLEYIRFSINAIIVLIDKKVGSYGKTDLGAIIGKPDSYKIITPIDFDANSINVTDDTETGGNCLNQYNYKLYKHDIKTVAEEGLKRPATSKLYLMFYLYEKRINLYDGPSVKYLEYQRNKNSLYVIFYNEDYRPLILSYNNQAFSSTSTYDYNLYKWTKERNIDKFGCNQRDGNDKLLMGLESVVGNLNSVKLEKKDENSPYEVHTFQNKKVQISLSYGYVNGWSGGQNCYKKVTHTPAGIEGGRGGDGYRLGSISYNINSKKIGSLNYSGGENKYYPLVSVTAYFYNEDTDHKDPLLVELEFKVNGRCKKEYYKLTTRNDNSLNWTKDTSGETIFSRDQVGYLDKLRYALKKALRIEIWHNSSKNYKVQLSRNKGGQGQFEPLKNPKQITVSSVDPCKALENTGYKCYKHELSKLGSEVHHQIGGLKFYIGSQDRSPGQPIKLYRDEKYSNAIDIYYNKCVGDLYVFFYKSDPRPLLICFGDVYKPRANSLYDPLEWTNVTSLNSYNWSSEGLKNTELLKELYSISMLISPVKLDEHSTGQSQMDHQYNIGTFYNPSRIAIKINVKAEDLICHRRYTYTSSISDYSLGEITHNGTKLFQSYEEYLNKVSIKYRFQFPDKVSVYYYLYDSGHEYPLMIVLEFKGSESENVINYKEYFKLTSKGPSKTWSKMDDLGFSDKIKNLEQEIKGLDVDVQRTPKPVGHESREQEKTRKENELQNTIESKLKSIRTNLDINYTDDQKKTRLFDSEKCNDDDTNLPVVIGGPVGGVAGLAGFVGGGYLIYVKLIASTAVSAASSAL